MLNWAELKWGHIGWAATLVLLAVAATATALPIYRYFLRRQRWNLRESLGGAVWRDLAIAHGVSEEIVTLVLRVASKVTGITQEVLRPDDRLYEEFGRFEPLIGQDCADAVIEGIEDAMREMYGIGWIPDKNLRSASIEEIVVAISKSVFRCARCGYPLQPLKSGPCSECGADIRGMVARGCGPGTSI